MTPRRGNQIQPLLASATARDDEQSLFLGETPIRTPNLAVRTGLGSTPFAARRIPAATNCCYVARQFTRQTLRGWGLQGICDDTVQIASELVANAVRHGQARDACSESPQTAVWLALALRPRTLLCVVRDPSQRHPQLAPPALLAERHRGLPIVNALSHTWGWTADTRTPGKSVWARVSIPAPPA
ncbi:ATP-binding protein [Streptomyces sp. NPDC002920]